MSTGTTHRPYINLDDVARMAWEFFVEQELIDETDLLEPQDEDDPPWCEKESYIFDLAEHIKPYFLERLGSPFDRLEDTP